MSFWAIDFPAIVAAVLAAVSCGLMGLVLVMRREAMMGDAISHMVLPGLVLGVWVTGLLGLPLLHGVNVVGAIITAVLGVALVRLLASRFGVEPRAAMGFVFTSFFALGVVMLEALGLSDQHIDVEHALFGSLETLIWPNLWDTGSLMSAQTYAGMPQALTSLAIALGAVAVFWLVLYRSLVLWLFDPDYALAGKLVPQWLPFMTSGLIAMVSMAAFEAVGAVLVVALLVTPAATAKLVANRFSHLVALTIVVALAMALMGYGLAQTPFNLGWLDDTLPASGMIAFCGGLVFTLVLAFGSIGRSKAVLGQAGSDEQNANLETPGIIKEPKQE